MMKAAQIARERGIPYFGICYGFQWATVEYARNVAGLADADSTECNPDTPTKVIYKLRDLLGVDDLGGTMRLGSYACELAPGSLAQRVYGATLDSRAAPPPLRVQLPLRARRSPSTACGFPADRPTASSSRSPSCPAIRGTSRCSSTRVQVEADAAASAVRGFVEAATSTRPQRAPRRQRRRTRVAMRGRSASGVRTAARPALPAVLPRIMSPVTPVQLGDITIGGGSPFVLIAGPCVIESEAHATRSGRPARRHRAAAARAVHLQGVVRQGEPHVGPIVPRTRARRRAARARGDQGALRRADPDRHPRAVAGGAGGRRRRRPADSGVPLPPDRPARRRGEDRPRRQHQEGPVPRARRHPPRGRQGASTPATRA